MSKILIDEKEYTKLLKANCELNTLMAGGVDNWEGYEWSFKEDLSCWNEEHPEQQLRCWYDVREFLVEEQLKAAKEQDFYVYLLWMDDMIVNCFTSFEAAENALYAEVSKDDYDEVTWANENCGFTFAKTSWGEIIEYQIQELRVNE